MGTNAKDVKATMKKMSEAQIADRLGEINQLRKDVEKEEKELKDQFKALGKQSIAGKFFAVMLMKNSRSSVNMELVKKELSADALKRCTVETSYEQVTVTKL
jgi:hypothetical protein